jgi:hypothetical protein
VHFREFDVLFFIVSHFIINVNIDIQESLNKGMAVKVKQPKNSVRAELVKSEE